MNKIRLACWILLHLLAGTSSFAQIDTATLTGRVADPSGHAVENAQVQLVDMERDWHRVSETNSSGIYTFPHIRPGNYRLKASASGYKSVEIIGLTLFVQDDVQQNINLALGSPLESVTMGSKGVPLQTSGTVGTVVEPSLIAAIPLNGRSFQTLFQLVPGVVITPTSFASQGQFSVNGQRTNTNNFIIDGVSANVAIAAGVNPGQSAGGSLPAVTAFGGTNSLISTDDVQEFAVLTSSYSAESGRMPGAQISIASKSGTKEFHGTVFDYLRNELFDANDWFANRNNLKRAPLRQNDYGGVFGGPLVNGSTFFFISYEGLRLQQPTSSVSDVPSIASRAAAPAPLKTFFNAYPLPNGADEGNGLAQAIYGFSNPSSLDTASLRVDHHVGESITMFARYVQSISDRKKRGAQINSISTVTDTHFALTTLTAGLTYFVTPHVTNDLRFNWSGTTAQASDQLDAFGGADPLLQEEVFPKSFSDKDGLFQFLPARDARNPRLSLGRNVSNSQRQISVADNAAYQIGAHILKAGIDFRTLFPDVVPALYSQVLFFADIGSALATSRGLAAVGSNSAVQSAFNNYSVYAQDTWRPQSRVSATLGVRWEYNPVPRGGGANELHPFAVRNIDNLSALSLAPTGTPLYRAPINNIAPRIGFAYHLRQASKSETVIKMGAGIFYDLGNGPAGNAFDGAIFPFSSNKVLVGVRLPLASNDAAAPLINESGPFSEIVAFPTLLKLPYTYHWSVALQQAIGMEQTFSLGYVGDTGHSLLRTEQYTGGVAGVPPIFGQLFFTSNAGYSNYNSVQAQFVRRSSSGSHILASYTWSHSFDNISSDATLNNLPARFLTRRDGYGPSDFDIRHTLAIGMSYDLSRVGTVQKGGKVFSNWLIDAIILARSSPPVDVVFTRNLGFASYDFRPSLIPGVPPYISDANVPGGRRLNEQALAVPASLGQGNLERNSFRGFPLLETDVAVGRRFAITRRMHVQVRAEAFNVFNHANFAPPPGHIGRIDSQGRLFADPTFGVSQVMLAQGLQTDSLSSGFSPLYQVGSPRSLQFALRVEFY